MNIISKTFILSLIIYPIVAQAAYYRWTDSNGKVHYSNRVPPSISQLGHTEITKDGMVKKKTLSSNKKRELELVRIQRAKQQKIDLEKKNRKLYEEAENNRLLHIFNNEEELIESYNSKLRLAQLNIDLLIGRHKTQSEKLELLERKLERAKTNKQSESLEKQIANIIDNLKVYQQAITQNVVEKAKVQKDYKKILKRFRDLMASKDSGAKLANKE